MAHKLSKRYIAFLALVAVMFIVLIAVMINLPSAVQTSDSTYQSSSAGTVLEDNQRSISITGARGSIYDVNGVPLAYDTNSYNVQFYKDPNAIYSSDRSNYTTIIQKTIDIIEDCGGTVIDSFLIKRDAEGNFYFDVQDLKQSQAVSRVARWCINMELVSDPKPQTDEERTEAYEKIYAEASPEDYYHQLRNKYRIPESVSYEDAVKILSIWQESQLMTYRSYIPVTIAYDVSFEVVSNIEAHAAELTGMSIEESTKRVYPQKDVACHIIGYTGKITQEEIDKLETDGTSLSDIGYSTESLIGKVGIEATQEFYLTSADPDKQGEKIVELDSSGTVIGEVSRTAAKSGDNVFLTIDLEMQELLENALSNNIGQAYAKQVEVYNRKKDSYDEELLTRIPEAEREDADPFEELNLVKSGAAIAIDVNSGRVLALVSSPTYDLNLFAGGISQEDLDVLLEDPAAPLFNNAISSRSTPGSIFKMCTAVAGYMEGVVTINEKINDEGPYTKYIQDSSRAPACWVRPAFWKHTDQDMATAIKNSCNYYFYTVADRLGIDKLSKWAQKLGLTTKTNIELTGETVGWIGSQQVRYDNTKDIDDQLTYKPLLVYNSIKRQLVAFGEQRGVEYSDEQITAAADRLIRLAGSGTTEIGPEVRKVLSEELDIPVNVSSTTYTNGISWSRILTDLLFELNWTATNTVEQGIGSEPAQLTPIAVARYVAALANGGKVFEPHIVDRVIDSDGNIIYKSEAVIVENLNLPLELTNTIKKGMEQVLSDEAGGTAGAAFANFEYKNQLVGKTGTAPVSNIDLEDNVWLITYAPKDDPEVALVVFLPHGLSEGVNAYPTTQAFWQYYFDSRKEKEPLALGDEGSVMGYTPAASANDPVE